MILSDMNFFASRLNRMGAAAVGAAMLIGSLAPLNAQVPIGGRIPDFVPPELPTITPCEIAGDLKEVPLPAAFDSLDSDRRQRWVRRGEIQLLRGLIGIHPWRYQ